MDQLITEDPTRIGPYRLIARLGAGGMGLVYLGRSEAGRTVAVKVVQAEHAQHPEFRRRFAREVEAARRVGGEWTAAVLDADTEAPVPWVATQYIPGPDLTTVVAKDFGPLPEHSVRVLANRLAVALQSVHAAGLIHRDLKPSNVLVTVDGPRVIDFGIARAMDGLGGDSLHTRTGMLIGSPGFMSPEQVRGLELTPASDVFCLGAVLVYASTGRLLFGAADTGLSAHLFRIAEDEPDLTGVPDSLIDLVRACLHKDPARRPTPSDVAARTAADLSEEWLPGAVLAQLGRHAARLLDFAPETRATPQDPRIPAQYAAGPQPFPPPPAYTPTAPVGRGPVPPGFGPALGTVPGAWGAPTAPAGPSGPSPRRWWGLVAAVLAQFLVVVGAMSTNVALPIIQADLQLSFDDLQLMSFSYVIAFGALLLLGGHLADLLGRKRMVIIGLAGFAVVSAVGGAAPAAGVLIAAHGLQGVFAALLSSAALSLVAGGFTDPKARGTAFGIYAVFAGGGLAFGGFVGSWLAYYVSWRWSLYAAVPLALMAVVPAALAEDDRSARAPARPDVPGLLLGTGALAALVFGFHQVEEPGGGWSSPLAVLLLLAGAALLATFAWRQTRTSSPLVRPGLFRDRDRVGSLLALLLAGVGTPTLFLTLSVYLQNDLDYTPYDLGLALLPLGGAVLVATQVAGHLQGRVAPRLLAVPGLVLAAAGMGLLAGLELDGSYASAVLPGTVLLGLGIGTALGPLLATATGTSGFQGSGGTAATVLAAQGFGGWLAFPLLVGIAPLGGYAAVLWTVAGFLLLASLLAGLMVRTSAPRRDR
ncbi:bifunctional serine/threonine protein kinase/MFS transporter [Streptomyces sp. NPDC127166]|uniref:bifunctional serine/threonine protein kinase/MFS transporter n=1 Tax=Streptomyces sp. NPDC127166 TaxID=3345380 RepID=UPI003627379C